MAGKKQTPPLEPLKGKRPYVISADIPPRSLREALRVAQAITDNYGGSPTAPHDVALALDISPTSTSWRDLSAASTAYGLTKGTWNAARISLETLGKRATAPTEEGDDQKAKAEAALKPKAVSGFFKKYNKAKFPPDLIAKNVLQQEFGVPAERVENVLRIIKDNGQYIGFIRDTKTGPFVAVDDPQPKPVRLSPEPERRDEVQEEPAGSQEQTASTKTPDERSVKPLRVFISHGKNTAIVDQVKDILGLYDIEYEVAVEEETSAIPVPTKVMAAMRRSNAGIMVVTADEQKQSGRYLQYQHQCPH